MRVAKVIVANASLQNDEPTIFEIRFIFIPLSAKDTDGFNRRRGRRLIIVSIKAGLLDPMVGSD